MKKYLGYLEKYSVAGFINLVLCRIRTIFLYSPAGLIRFPIDIRGRKQIHYGNGMTTGRSCRIEVVGKRKGVVIWFGKNVQINDNVHIVGMDKVIIGNDVLIASKVFISDCSHGSYSGNDCSSPDTPPRERKLVGKPVAIEDRVWLGDNVVVMPGVTIGYGSIIGASAVVVDSIPPESIAVGIPARVIKRFDHNKQQWILV